MVSINASVFLPPGNTWVGVLMWFRPWRLDGGVLSLFMAMVRDQGPTASKLHHGKKITILWVLTFLRATNAPRKMCISSFIFFLHGKEFIAIVLGL